MTEKKQPWITGEEARKILDVAPATFARLVREGVLKYEVNPLDNRQKLFDKQAVIELRDRYKR
jgi:hypothetical protein